MKKIIFVLSIVSLLSGCTFNTSDSSKPTSYTLDSVNPR